MLQICDKIDDIPRILWTYWAHGEPPEFIKLCINNWKFMNPEYSINIVQFDTINQYIPDKLPEKFDTFIPQHQADWVRLALLKNYGGFWLDASIILTEPLDWVKAPKHEGFVYYNPSHTKNSEFPVIENWFIAVKKHSRFINHWFNEFDRVCNTITIPGDGYHLELKREYKQQYDEIVANIPAYLHNYLIPYFCAQKIAIVDSMKGLLKVEDCFTGPYYGCGINSWREREFLEDFLVNTEMEFNPKLIKIVNHERKYFDNINQNICKEGSIFYEFLFHKKHNVKNYSHNKEFGEYKKFSWML